MERRTKRMLIGAALGLAVVYAFCALTHMDTLWLITSYPQWDQFERGTFIIIAACFAALGATMAYGAQP